MKGLITCLIYRVGLTERDAQLPFIFVFWLSNFPFKLGAQNPTIQPVHRADAPKFKVFIKEFMNTFRYIKPVSYTI